MNIPGRQSWQPIRDHYLFIFSCPVWKWKKMVPACRLLSPHLLFLTQCWGTEACEDQSGSGLLSPSPRYKSQALMQKKKKRTCSPLWFQFISWTKCDQNVNSFQFNLSPTPSRRRPEVRRSNQSQRATQQLNRSDYWTEKKKLWSSAQVQATITCLCMQLLFVTFLQKVLKAWILSVTRWEALSNRTRKKPARGLSVNIPSNFLYWKTLRKKLYGPSKKQLNASKQPFVCAFAVSKTYIYLKLY